MDRLHFFNLTRDELREQLSKLSMPSFRADQLLDWVYRKNIADPKQMLNLSKADRQRIEDAFYFTSSHVIRHQAATDGVQKLLVQWEDEASPKSGLRSPESRAQSPESKGNTKSISLHIANPQDSRPGTPDSGLLSDAELIPDPRRQTECVMIPTDDVEETGRRQRRTACISSQVGCAVGCKFCASGLGGLDGDLTAGRIIEQVWRLGTLEGVGRISNVVFMGMGEPLANFTQVTKAIRTMTADWGLGISARRITLSTVGLPAQMRRLADLEIPVTLAISLHAPNDELRRQLIPWAEYVTIDQLLDAGDYYFDKPVARSRWNTFCWAASTINQSTRMNLARVASRLRANVNLIRYNEVKGLPFDRPHTEDVRDFQKFSARQNQHAHPRQPGPGYRGRLRPTATRTGESMNALSALRCWSHKQP